MKNNNIYDDIFNLYVNRKSKECDTPLSKFENDMDIILKDDFELYQKTINNLHSLLDETRKEYFIEGMKTALELFR